MPRPEATVIIGAGIAGVALAYELAVRRGFRRVTLVDMGDPLALTSDKSTECYRNWWPDAPMVQLMNRSIDLLEEYAHATRNAFRLNRRGYVYATADPGLVGGLQQQAERAAAQGAGPVRVNDYEPSPLHGFATTLTGCDVVTHPALLQQHFPYLSPRTQAVLHTRRAGWFSATELGVYLLEQARAHGVRFVRGQVTRVQTTGGRVQGAQLADGTMLPAEIVVNAAGPLAAALAQKMGVELPLFCERHTKLAFADTLDLLPREAPLLIWADPQFLRWETEESQMLAEAEDTRWLLRQFPAGVHTRPEGGSGSNMWLMLWAYDAHPVTPTWPVAFDPSFPEVVLRGLTAMLPTLQHYLGRMGRPILDGGYYVKTRENRPLIGPVGPTGSYLIGALSGFGVMAAYAAADLLADHLTGAPLPPYAPAFLLERYQDPAYQRQMLEWEEGQL